MRARLIAARDRGIYVSVMLFEGWELQRTDAWKYHPFNPSNNVNAVDADADKDGKGLGYNTIERTEMGKRVLVLQEAYLRKVIETVSDLDNVLYEVCNEAGDYSTEWQYHVISFVKKEEAGRPKQHPVGMTFQWPPGKNEKLFNSPADWISPGVGEAMEYRESPPADYKGKVIVNDTDHLWGHTGGDSVWVWKSFTRGMQVLFMEELLPSPTWQDSARSAMGQTRRYAQKMNLAEMVPSTSLATTGYCLANPGREYLVFQTGSRGEFSVNLADAPGRYSVEWLNVNTGATIAGKPANGGGNRVFTTPFGGPAALYLKLIPSQ